MSFLGKLFRGKEAALPAASPLLPKPAGDPSKDPDLIRVFDSYGRELFITRQEWRDNVLLGNLKNVWDQPDALYGMIVGALNDGFRADVVEAARQLFQIDPTPSRGACVWGIVLMEEGRLDEAEKVFRDHMAMHGEDGVILTNLAKVYAARKDHVQAEEVLWHALEFDPNQDNGVLWYEVIHRERGGETAGQEALRRVAALSGSWRAQLWLARAALKDRDLERALALYRESLDRAPRPAPADLLMQISGDLGNTAHLPEILQLVEPQFDASTHGLPVGNNLLKAHLDLGQIDHARRVLDQLYALQRPDWRETLSYWDNEIAKARLAPEPPPQAAALKVAMLRIEGPVWLRPDSPAADLFPARPGNRPLITFLGSCAEVPTNSKRVAVQMPDFIGRLSRALPLFLAEQLELTTTAAAQTLIPWIVSDSPGFVLGGSPWEDAAAAGYARQNEAASDFIVTAYLRTRVEPWAVELRLVRTIDARCVSELRADFPSAHPEMALPGLARRLAAALETESGVQAAPPSPLYLVPEAAQFPYYLVRLEKLLALRCGSMDGVPSGFLSGERDIIEQNIQLCLACPENVVTRILLAQSLLALKRVRPDILPEFRDKVARLQTEQPLLEPARAVVQRLMDDSFRA